MRLTALALSAAVALSATAQTAPDSTAADSARAELDRLPLRTVREAAALAPGVRRDLATGLLSVRSRAGSPVFLVDGVRQLGGPRLPFEAVAGVGVLTEGVPARYGQAAGGLVVVETEAGADAFGGRLEAFSSRATDAFDRDLGALALRGPLGTVGGFSLAAELGRAGDATPIGGPGALVLTDEAQARLLDAPQSIVVIEDGQTRTLPFPGAAARAAFDADRAYTDADLRAALGLGASAQIGGLVSTLSTLTEADYRRQRADDEPLDDLRLQGTVALMPLAGLSLRLGGRLDRQALGDRASPALQTRLRFAPGSGYEGELSGRAAWLQARHDLTPAFGYRLSASFESRDDVIHPLGFSSSVFDALDYGDLDSDRASMLRTYAQRGASGYEPLVRTDGQGLAAGDDLGLFYSPGALFGFYRRRDEATAQLAGSVIARLGGARIEVGVDAERQTFRQYALRGGSLAQYAADGELVRSVPGQPLDGVRAYEELSYPALWPLTDYYGYTFNGLATTDQESIDNLFTFTDGVPVSSDLAPFRPTTVAGFGQASFALGALAVRAGLRVEAYGRGGETLFDVYANRPVLRAGSLPSRPEGIGEEFAVYFVGGVRGSQNVVGFRDLDGRLFDAGGQPISITDLQFRAGVQVIDDQQPISAAFAPSPTHVSVQPRLSARFEVSDAVVLTASYDRLSRRPPPELHSTVLDYARATGSDRLVGSDLRPEQLDAFRVGARARVSPALAVSAAVFHRQSRGEIVLRSLLGALSPYSVFTNDRESSQTGADLAVAWAPLAFARVTGAYTLAFAEATYADPVTLGRFAFGATSLNEEFFTSPEDTRHEIDATLALRTPSRLGGVGLGLTVAAQSGLPYTALEATGEFRADDSFTSPAVGGINGKRLPWTSQVDLRLGKQVRLAGAAVEVFGWVENLLGTDNVLAVYRGTRVTETDGFAEAFGGLRFEGNPGGRQLYRAYVDGPANVGGAQSTSNPFFYGQPRQIRIGVRATL